MNIGFYCTNDYISDDTPSESLSLIPYQQTPPQDPILILSNEKRGFINKEILKKAILKDKVESLTHWLDITGAHDTKVNIASKKQPLFRAMNSAKNTSTKLVDLCAGFANDASIFFRWGYKLTLIEQHPAIAYALKLTCKNNQVQLIEDNCQYHMHDLAQTNDIFYLDPMYHKKETSAKSQGHAQLLQQLTATLEDNANQLLLASLQTRIKRIVIKRPRKAPYLAQKTPTVSYTGTTTRYDVYIR
ncbi:MAG: class I SAM-dependent methyltransferase [Methylacidiphilales bacterium]|nr:class I SAM-dependent methyltransferase [Candidatus Methylacidiphilales bacterium]